MIYLRLGGRIGNQLFMYAAARMIQVLTGDNQEIVIEDYGNRNDVEPYDEFENSLQYYPLKNVTFVHDLSIYHSRYFLLQRFLLRCLSYLEKNKTHRFRYELEKRCQWILNLGGVFRLIDGYTEYPKRFRKHIFVNGYFQSEKYFFPIRDEIKKLFQLEEVVEKTNYPNIKKIKERNTVCISIKVQSNAGHPIFNVCDKDYYRKAIELINKKVENPLFFICSDNLEYVRESLIDFTAYDFITQDMTYPVHISLAVMAQCKHFIINNTSFGWWAQYLCENPDKIVIAPSKWFAVDIPCDIYQDDWIKIEV